MMLFPTLAACSNGSTPAGSDTTAATINNDTVAPAETEPAETKFDPFATFPEDLSYAGRTFTIHNGNTGTSWYTCVLAVSEEQTGMPSIPASARWRIASVSRLSSLSKLQLVCKQNKVYLVVR